MKLRVALIYPAPPEIGIANLGFNAVFRLINSTDGFTCDRIFYDGKIRNIDSRRDIKEYPIVAFSVSFLPDYLKIPEIVKSIGIPIFSKERKEMYPLIIGGGNAFSINPEPAANLFDAIVIGDGEGVMEKILLEIKKWNSKWKILEGLNEIQSVYVPLLNTKESRKMVFKNRKEPSSLPAWSEDGGKVFRNTGLVEIGRGCRWKCSFCPIGFLHVPPRFYDIEKILTACRKTGRKRIGLVAPVVPDHPSIKELLKALKKNGYEITTSSWRADLYDEELFELLKGEQKTITIAPETGSYRLRRLIGKDIPDEKILEGIKCARNYFKGLRAYFIIGLPQEKDEDIKGIVDLVDEMAKIFGKRLTLRVNPFVPFPHTPLMNENFPDEGEFSKKLGFLKKGVQRFATTKSKGYKETLLEFILAWSGREILSDIIENRNLKNFEIIKNNLDFIQYPFDERSLNFIAEREHRVCPPLCKSCLHLPCKTFRAS